MFSTQSPVASVPQSSGRNPRRRPRTQSGENGLSIPRAKRHRSALSEETFMSPEPTTNKKTNGHELNGFALQNSRPVPSRQLAARETKKIGERGNRLDNASLLTSNDNYAAIQLHALPDRIRSRPDEMYRGSIYSDAGAGYGLALSSSTATIWSYNSSSTSPETFTFSLSDRSKTSVDQLPLGSLVYSSTSATDLGLVVITPSNGKITYWESVTGAVALDHNGQQRNGVEGSVGGLFSGDTVVELLSAEPAGFILRFASGRLAHLSIRDGQGRPSVIVHYMKGHVNNSNGGLFGGIISAFGNHGWRKDVVSIKAGRTSKQLDREIIVATDQGHFQVWEVHRNGQHMLRSEVDAKEALLHATSSTDFASEGQRASNFRLLDFALIPDLDVDQQIVHSGINMLALVAFVDNDHASYRIIDLTVDNGAVLTHASTLVRCYAQPPEHDSADLTSTGQVKLLLPKPGNLAFVVFSRAIVLVSVVRPVDTPDQQLFRESREPNPLFQDVIDFRAGSTAAIVGCGSEDAADSQHLTAEDPRHSRRKSRYPGCIALVKGFGVLRVSAFTATSASAIIDAPSITAKSKIEQAIFYGTSPQNILNFIGRPEVQFPLIEVEHAALEVSREILNSTSAAIPAMTPSMNAHLTNRARALRNLAVYLKNAHPILSLPVRWKLLADAEKLAGARAVWKLYNASLRGQQIEDYDEAQDDVPYGERASALAAIIDCLPPDAYTPLQTENGEVDRVRNWFSKDVDRIEVVVSRTFQTLAELIKEGLKDDFTLMRAIGEANDVCLGAIGTAFRFRQDNLALYSLGDQNLQDGLLVDFASYRELAPFWTSALSGPGLTSTVPETLKMMINIVKEISLQFLGKTSRPFPGRKPDPETAEKVRLDCVGLLDLYSKSAWEAYAWLESRTDQQQRQLGKRMREDLSQTRNEVLMSFPDLGLTEEGIRLCEKYHSFGVLSMLVEGKLLVANAVMTSRSVDKEGRAEAERIVRQTEDLIDDYFDRPGFGDAWAEVYFTYLLRDNKAVRLLDRFSMHRKFVVQFFASKPQYAKISWMNNIMNEHRYDTAGEELLRYQNERETDVWSKKIELSLGRLCLLADLESKQIESGEATSEPLDMSEPVPQPPFVQSFVSINAQEQLRDSIAPLVESALDETAAVQLVLESRGKIAVKGKPKLANLLEEGVAHLVDRRVLSKAQLVNALTLLDADLSDDTDDFALGRAEYFLALEVLNATPDAFTYDEIPKSVLEMIVWRRCMLRDDWEELNMTEDDDDRIVMGRYEETALYETLRLGYIKGFWSPETGKATPFRPRDVLEAGCTPESLGSKLDLEVREALARDLSLEATQLGEQIQKGRLDDLFDGLNQYVKETVEKTQKADAEAIKDLVHFEAAMRVKPIPVWFSNVKPSKNGKDEVEVQVNGYHVENTGDDIMADVQDSTQKLDADGDVSMHS